MGTGGPSEGREQGEGKVRKMGGDGLGEAISKAKSLRQLGVLLWWAVHQSDERIRQTYFSNVSAFAEKFAEQFTQGKRVYRSRRALFPLPFFWEDELRSLMEVKTVADLVDFSCRVSDVGKSVWSAFAALFCNHLFNNEWKWSETPATAAQEGMKTEIENGVTRILDNDADLVWEEQTVEEDMKKRNVGYSGEEISLPEKLTLEQVIPGLPPESHGGRIDAASWTGDKCRWYLEHPKECLLEDNGQDLPKLQAKVHVDPDDRLALGKLLVERNICRWIREDEILKFRGTEVLNGLFGVEKPKTLPDGRPVLRLIMNLIPSNSIHKCITGRVNQLPHITRWGGVVLAEDEILHVCQSDMQSAFYLFALPREWSGHLAFNLKMRGKDLGMETEDADTIFTLASAVLPMGWSSAVGVMQYIAEEVLYRKGMPSLNQIRRTNPLPPWMVETLDEADKTNAMWWHVYLDNYASGEKVKRGQPKAGEWQHHVERCWEEAGIISSKEKAVRDETTAVELGAYIGGKGRWIGASAERLLKVIKTTLWLIRRPRLAKKLLQVVLGRWVFVLQFRRPAMAHFQICWDFISGKIWGRNAEDAVREELLGCVFGTMLYHTFLGARIDTNITCSDASQKGGAVAVATGLSDLGDSYLRSQESRFRPKKIPVVVVSLFNGVGAVFRCFDIAGLELAGGIACDIHTPAQRVTSRRWPWVVLTDDVRGLTKEKLEELIEEMPYHVCIQVWMGFPCVDLSSAKANRRNLEGSQSSLVFEGKRVLDLLKELYPDKLVQFIVENVASMDASARDAISEIFEVTPIKLDPSSQVPMSRPRLCWTDVVFPESSEIQWTEKEGYWELYAESDWPSPKDWLEPGAVQWDADAIYPTCMKSIPRARPPDRPAGIARCDWYTIRRWESSDFRFPPYQFKETYLILEASGKTRLLSAEEREALMGLGKGHTSVCLSASKAKANKTAFNDERLSLIGDSFACSSFMLVAAASGFRCSNSFLPKQMCKRLGLPPGASSAVEVCCPLSEKPTYGTFDTSAKTMQNLNLHLARRANHTGSDVRLITGEFMNPRQSARQSVVSSWWQWQHVFRVKWEHEEHINPLECRAIFLGLCWKGRQGLLRSRRVFHLTDSYVCQSILSKGRTSSVLMRPVVRKINALLLANHCLLLVAHVDSADNPTDAASREA